MPSDRELHKSILKDLGDKADHHEGLVRMLPRPNLEKLHKMDTGEKHAELQRIHPLAVKHQKLATCHDCSRVTWFDDKEKKGNAFMVHDDLWKKHVGSKKKIVCPHCLEKRMGRKMKKSDLKPDTELNKHFSHRGLNESFEQNIEGIFGVQL
jgi:hypothetical protein